MEEQFEEIIETIEQEEEVKTGEKIRAFFKEMLETILIALVLILVIEGLSDRVKIEGFSMLPSLHQNDRVIVSKLAYRSNEIERGDIVVFDYPNNPEEEYIKRVIGIPGDVISISDGSVVLNGDVLEENYIDDFILGEMEELVVPAGTVFVLGDNRNHSSDSRYWGSLPSEYIIGKAIFIYWPFADLSLIETPDIFAHH
jgi:signal peptidase I